MTGGAGNQTFEETRIQCHHGPGDARHAHCHRGEQGTAAHRLDVGADQQRRFDHAEKNIGSRRRAERTTDAQCALQRPTEAFDDFLQNAPMIEQSRQHAHEEDQRQGAKSQDEGIFRCDHPERRWTARNVAEHELQALFRRGLQRRDRPIHTRKDHT